MIRIGIVYWGDHFPSGAPSYINLPSVPHIGETINMEDTIMIGANPTPRIRWFVVKGVAHFVVTDRDVPPAVVLYVEPKQ